MSEVASSISAREQGRFGALHTHRFLFRVALALSNVFAWIFILQYFFILTGALLFAVLDTVLMYCLAQAITIILTPISASHLRGGVKRSLVYGSLAGAGAYFYLGATFFGFFNSAPTGWGIAVFAILWGAYRALYWIPYSLEASTHANRSHMPIFYELVIACMPAFAGITLGTSVFAPGRILFGSALFILLSLVFLIPVRDVYEKFSWGYGRTFRELFSWKRRAILFTSVAHGFQGTALFLFWPISIFFILSSDYETLGIVLSVTLLCVLFFSILYRRFSRGLKLERSVFAHVAFSVSGWIMRLFAGTPAGIIFADAYSYASIERRSHSLDVAGFEQSADQGSFIDEYTALKEMGLAFGRIGICIIFAFSVLLVPLSIALALMLVIAAVASVVSIVLERSASAHVL